MTAGGAFGPAARATILGATDGRCAGCGAVPVTCQLRRARGMGGTTSTAAGHPANGVALCGSGTTGCHGWAEHHPEHAARLGWRLRPGEDPHEAPWWHYVLGWRRWVTGPDGYTGHAYVDEDDLEDLPARLAAITAQRASLTT